MAPRTPKRPGPPKTKYSRPPRRASTPRPPHSVPARRAVAAPAPHPEPKKSQADEIFEEEKSILDLIDNLLNQGVVLSGELILGVAGVDLVYLRLNALLAAADRVLPQSRATNAKARAVARTRAPSPLPASGAIVDAE